MEHLLSTQGPLVRAFPIEPTKGTSEIKQAPPKRFSQQAIREMKSFDPIKYQAHIARKMQKARSKIVQASQSVDYPKNTMFVTLYNDGVTDIAPHVMIYYFDQFKDQIVRKYRLAFFNYIMDISLERQIHFHLIGSIGPEYSYEESQTIITKLWSKIIKSQNVEKSCHITQRIKIMKSYNTSKRKEQSMMELYDIFGSNKKLFGTIGRKNIFYYKKNQTVISEAQMKLVQNILHSDLTRQAEYNHGVINTTQEFRINTGNFLHILNDDEAMEKINGILGIAQHAASTS